MGGNCGRFTPILYTVDLLNTCQDSRYGTWYMVQGLPTPTIYQHYKTTTLGPRLGPSFVLGPSLGGALVAPRLHLGST